jgi:Carboxypeptidase regulatory-like domain/TonB dependent receptor
MLTLSRNVARRAATVVLALGLAFGSAGPLWAGTTGILLGTVTDDNGAPVADAVVTVASPSQTATTKTDAKGAFTFVSLAPDTYAVSIAHAGFDPLTINGISIFADQTQKLPFRLKKSLRTIASVQSRSNLDEVRSGTITDVYSVNPAVTRAAAPIGGGGSLNNAYSAIASQPGSFVPPGQMGVNQTVYIRGGNYDQIGYEYDGVPMNRSFDNYPAHSASTLGQQELQIYAGGGGASTNATGLAGFINQVVKTGTFPGYGNVSGMVGGPTFYHDTSVEAGGSTPDRMFSYYVGISGYNQAFRYFDNSNGAGLTSEFPYTIGPNNDTTFLPFYPAVYPSCNPTTADYTNPLAPTNYPPKKGQLSADPGCFSFLPPQYANVSFLEGREAVVNLHFGIPHKNDGGHDDIQLLYTSSAQYRQYYSGVDDSGLPYINGLVKNGFIQQPQWPDYYTYKAGTQFLAPATTPPAAYYFPGSPTNRCANVTGVPQSCPDGTVAALPDDYRGGRWDTASIMKLQYQKNFGSNAYLRAFGYLFYSYTDRSDATGKGIGSGFGATNYEYTLNSHTSGMQLDFGDQMSSTNLLTASANYLSSATLRLQNFNDFNTGGQQVSNLTNGQECFAFRTGVAESGKVIAQGDPAPCNDPISQGDFESPTNGQSQHPCTTGRIGPATPACKDGASWLLTYTGNQGLVNNVSPAFTNLALTDDYRPTDKLDISMGLKYSLDNFTLGSTGQPGKDFWFTAAQNEFCYNPVTFNVVLIPQPPQDDSSVNPLPVKRCPIDRSSGTPVQTVHPDGKNGHILLSNNYPPVYSQNYWQPRIGMTFTVNPNTVFRVSAGRYAQEPQNYEVQYNSEEENLASEIVGFLPYGFDTPFHNAQPQYSNNYDISYERRFKGTDMSIKVTPYYRYATQQLDENVDIPTLLASPALNAGTEVSDGVEFQFTKGDFNRNGVAAVFSYTYLNSVEKWNNYQGVPINAVDPYNQAIQEFNALTGAGGGSQCYVSNSNTYRPDPTCTTRHGYNHPISNPYFHMPPQALLNKNAWYDTGLQFPYTVPNVFALILNYKHNRFSITPAITLNEGSTYGTPEDVQGIDPRTCSVNQGAHGLPTNNPLAADYTSCGSAATPTGSLYIPNPQTGTFDSFGQYRQPWQLNIGLQLHYDFSNRLSGNLTVANLSNYCFGGSRTPWSSKYPADGNVCGYISNPFYISNFYNGTGPNDVAANGAPLNQYFTQTFIPAYGDTNSFNYPQPLNLYFQLQVKL